MLDEVEVDSKLMTRYGPIENGLADVVGIGANAMSDNPLRVCPFARRLLGEASARVCRNGMYVITAKARVIVYELFPIKWVGWTSEYSGPPIYLGVKRADIRW